MILKIVCTGIIVIWQIFLSVTLHKNFKNKKYDMFNAIYQLTVFIIYQLLLWIVI